MNRKQIIRMSDIGLVAMVLVLLGVMFFGVELRSHPENVSNVNIRRLKVSRNKRKTNMVVSESSNAKGNSRTDKIAGSGLCDRFCSKLSVLAGLPMMP